MSTNRRMNKKTFIYSDSKILFSSKLHIHITTWRDIKKYYAQWNKSDSKKHNSIT